MPLINTSQDLLNVIIAIAIIGLVFFTCWAIFYLAMILRQGFQVIKEMRERLHKVDTVIDTLKQKIESSTSYLFLIGEGIKKLIEIMKGREEKKARGKKSEKRE